MAPGTDPATCDRRHCWLRRCDGNRGTSGLYGGCYGRSARNSLAPSSSACSRWEWRGGCRSVHGNTTPYILELGRRHKAPLNVERVTAALVGGFVGWLLKIWLGVNLIRLVVPKEPPHSFYQALVTALLIGGLSGSITALSGAAIYRAKAWKASPIIRLALGGLALAAAAVMISMIASPEAAIGPGSGAISWVESATGITALTVLAVDVLRAVATTATAGGCGGVFVPFFGNWLSGGASLRPVA